MIKIVTLVIDEDDVYLKYGTGYSDDTPIEQVAEEIVRLMEKNLKRHYEEKNINGKSS